MTKAADVVPTLPTPEAAAEAAPKTAEQPKFGDAVRADAQRRANECGKAIEAALREYRCRIVPFLKQEPVGQDGAAMLTRADFGIFAQ